MGPFFIPINGKNITLVMFLFFVFSLSFFKFIVEIKLIIFLFFKIKIFKIFSPTLGVIAKKDPIRFIY